MGIGSRYVNVQVKVQWLFAVRNHFFNQSGGENAWAIQKCDEMNAILDSLPFECEGCGSKYTRKAFPEETLHDEMVCFDCAIKTLTTHVEDLEANREGMVEVSRSEEEAIPTLG